MVSAFLLALQLTGAQQIERAVAQGIEDGVYPGAVVVVGTSSGVIYGKGFGHFTWAGDSPEPDPRSTLFDLASLTKVVAATPALMLLVDQSRIDLDRAIRDYLPEFDGPGKDEVTVRHLLEHRSGLRAFLPLDKETSTAIEARQRVLSEPLRHSPGGVVEYSDLNAMLMGWVVERVSNQPLDSFVSEHFFGRLGMGDTRFRPPRSVRDRIPPVGLWRGHAIAGEVHDQNAARLDGVSGHAGLYSTGRDLAAYARWLLNEGVADIDTVVRAATIREFTRRGTGNRALGWEMRDTTTADNTGTSLSIAAYGHGGFTGTSIWLDPVHDVFVLVLTNRVFAPRTRRSISKLKAIRGLVADGAFAMRRERACAADASGC